MFLTTQCNSKYDIKLHFNSLYILYYSFLSILSHHPSIQIKSMKLNYKQNRSKSSPSLQQVLFLWFRVSILFTCHLTWRKHKEQTFQWIKLPHLWQPFCVSFIYIYKIYFYSRRCQRTTASTNSVSHLSFNFILGFKILFSQQLEHNFEPFN